MFEDDGCNDLSSSDVGNFKNRIVENAYKNERTIYLFGDITQDLAFVTVRQIEKLCEKSNEPIILKIQSLGGDLFAGLAIISAIETAKDSGVKVIGRVYGMAMSVALSIISVCSYRISQKYARFMLHDILSANMSLFQSRQERKDSSEEDQLLWDKIQELLIRDTKFDPNFIEGVTERKKEFYFWPEQAIEFGVIDEII